MISIYILNDIAFVVVLIGSSWSSIQFEQLLIVSKLLRYCRLYKCALLLDDVFHGVHLLLQLQIFLLLVPQLGLQVIKIVQNVLDLLLHEPSCLIKCSH